MSRAPFVSRLRTPYGLEAESRPPGEGAHSGRGALEAGFAR